MRGDERNRQTAARESRCPVCAFVLVPAGGEVEPAGRRIRCRSCGNWVYADGSVLRGPRTMCRDCGQPVSGGSRRCPRCEERRTLWRRFTAWLRRRRSSAPKLRSVPITRIRCRGLLPRRTLDARTFRILLRSIRVHGILTPLLVRPAGPGYELIAGHRRLLAAYKLGLKEVPVIVRRAEAREIEELRLLEDASHEAWQPLDVAAGIERLCLASSPAEQRDLLRIMEIREADVPDRIRILAVPELLKDAVSLGLIGEDEALRLAEEPDTDTETLRQRLGIAESAGAW